MLPDSVTISACHRRGAFYGFQSFRQLLPGEAFSYSPVHNGSIIWQALCVTVEDKPRFAWRGMMLDTARTFSEVPFIHHFIDWLALHKINVFHWHLSDDEGWRLEIKGLPELTRSGCWSGNSCSIPVPKFRENWFPSDARHGGFYTQDQVKEVVEYATARNVRVLPEVDLPGHSLAIIAAYPQIACRSAHGRSNVWCASRPENDEVMELILTEISSLFPFEYIHVGGDEVSSDYWQHCESCNKLAHENDLQDGGCLQPLFTRKLETICAKLNRKLIGWNEILDSGISKTASIMSWSGPEPGYRAASMGHQVVMCPGKFFYLDMSQMKGERGHSWAGIVTLERCYSFDLLANVSALEVSDKFLGVQACLWTEFCLSCPSIQEKLGLLDRQLLLRPPYDVPAPPGFLDYQINPRLAAVAEVGWTSQEKRNFNEFSQRLGHYHLPRLECMSVLFRIPVPRAEYSSGYITVIPPWHEAVVRYSADGTEPTISSPECKHPIPCSEKELYKFRFVTTVGERRSSTVLVSN